MSAHATLGRLGRYEILGLLATGGMAEIFLARVAGPLGFEHPVVIKRVLPHLARQRIFREMFVDEARIVSRIRHPAVVNVHELGDQDSELFLVMEYLEGESLSLLLKRLRSEGRSLPLRAALAVVADACAGLHAAHELRDGAGAPLGIVHRDVSPQNLFVLYSGQVKVIDFGIAKAMDRTGQQTETGQVKGKFAYMAPEQIASKSVDRRADLFALGAVLHELVAGKKLFEREHDLLVLKAVCEEPILPPSATVPGLPPSVDGICARALSRNPEERYQSAAEMRRDIVALVAQLPGADLAEEELARTMAELFADRRAQKQEILRRAREGRTITHVPSADGSDVHLAVPEPAGSGTALRAHAVDLPPPRRSTGRWVAVAAVALAGAGFAVWRSRAAPVESAATQGVPDASIVIGSTPPGATVTIDGKMEGTTPTTVSVPRGTSEIEIAVVLDGFETHVERIVPSGDARLGIGLRPVTAPVAAASSAATSSAATSSAATSSAATVPLAGVLPPAGARRPVAPARAVGAPVQPTPTPTASGGFSRFE